MSDWFTVEQLDTDTYAISEYAHWEQPHCYLLCGTKRALLIDTGLGVADLRAVVRQLTTLPVTVATTHVHWDHIGGHGLFKDITVHPAERHWLDGQFPLPPAVVRQNLTRRPCAFPEGFEPQNYRVFQGAPNRCVEDEDWFDLGNRRIQVLHTPGHSPGHCCFYEPQRNTLYSGDLIYAGKLDAFYPTTDPQAFGRSVQRMSSLPIQAVRPGHFSLQVTSALIGAVADAFASLENDGKLQQGSGVYHFDSFCIHL